MSKKTYYIYREKKSLLYTIIFCAWSFHIIIISLMFLNKFKINHIFIYSVIGSIFMSIVTAIIKSCIKNLKCEPDPPGTYIGPRGIYRPVNPPTPPSEKPQAPDDDEDPIEKLTILAELLELGHITREEFDEQKRLLLK